MNPMAEAMKKAGVVDEKDIERVTEQTRIDEEVRLIADEMMRRFEIASQKIPVHLVREMVSWMEANKLIPIEVIESWALISRKEGVDGVQREWAKWLSAWREVKAQN